MTRGKSMGWGAGQMGSPKFTSIPIVSRAVPSSATSLTRAPAYSSSSRQRFRDRRQARHQRAVLQCRGLVRQLRLGHHRVESPTHRCLLLVGARRKQQGARRP